MENSIEITHLGGVTIYQQNDRGIRADVNEMSESNVKKVEVRGSKQV